MSVALTDGGDVVAMDDVRRADLLEKFVLIRRLHRWPLPTIREHSGSWSISCFFYAVTWLV